MKTEKKEIIENNIKHYRPFTPQRMALRALWNGSNTDWWDYLNSAELRAQKVQDAINEPIENMSVEDIESLYKDLYKL